MRRAPKDARLGGVGRRSASSGSDEGRTLARPEEVALFNMAAYELSRREEEVARLLARGASTKEISAALHISEYTVQNHLRNVFEKVGVRSRGELLKRLFFDNVFPSMFA